MHEGISQVMVRSILASDHCWFEEIWVIGSLENASGHMAVSINGKPPNGWFVMVYNRKSHENGWFGGTHRCPYFRKPTYHGLPSPALSIAVTLGQGVGPFVQGSRSLMSQLSEEQEWDEDRFTTFFDVHQRYKVLTPPSHPITTFTYIYHICIDIIDHLALDVCRPFSFCGTWHPYVFLVEDDIQQITHCPI